MGVIDRAFIVFVGFFSQLSFSLVERRAENENFECVIRVPQLNHMNCIFPNYMVDTMIVYAEVALGLFSLQ